MNYHPTDQLLPEKISDKKLNALSKKLRIAYNTIKNAGFEQQLLILLGATIEKYQK